MGGKAAADEPAQSREWRVRPPQVASIKEITEQEEGAVDGVEQCRPGS